MNRRSPWISRLARASLAGIRRQPLAQWALRYGLAVAAVVLAMEFRLVMTAWVGHGLPTYVTFYPAIMAVALLGGLGPGLTATVLTGLVASHWILPPEGFAIALPVDRLGLAIFASMGVFMNVVAESYRRNRDKAAAYDRESALRETRQEKEFLADLVEHASQPFAVGYPDGRLGRLNHAFEQLTGFTAAELCALDWSATLTPPEWHEFEGRKLDELHRTGQPVRYEKEYIRKDGSRVPIEVLAHLVRDAAGKPEYYYSFVADITERKRAEEALRQSEQRVRLKLQSILSPEGDVSQLDLADIIDVPAIQVLMDHFHELARIPMAIIDLQGRVLVGAGWQDVCTKFHRVHPETCKHCIESDTQLSAGVASGEFKLYKCKNHMWDVATPIMVGGRHVGNLFTGQFFFDDEPVDYESFRSQARSYGFGEQPYLAALDAVPRLSRKSVDAGMGFFIRLAEMLSLLSYANIKLARSLTERDALIAERRRAEETLRQGEERIRASLAEKEVMLKEIHHRVKNNMQVISSLVALQADRLPDAAMRAILEDVTHRVRSMALVHEKLYQSADMARVEFAEYAQSLLNYLWRAHETAVPGVRLALDLQPVLLSVNAAVPCGLILNELASNALKHAFRGRAPLGSGGEVTVSLRGGPDGQVCLSVRDNGTGLPAGFDWRQANSLGLRLVQMLAGQLHATVDVRNGDGTEFTIAFGGSKTLENRES